VVSPRDDRFQSFHDVDESFPHLDESSDDVEKSFHDLDEAFAVLVVSPDDRERLAAVLEGSLHALVRWLAARFRRREHLKKSSARRKLSFNARGFSFAVMRKSFGGLCGSGAYRFRLDSSVG
jgi:hypothetical protein